MYLSTHLAPSSANSSYSRLLVRHPYAMDRLKKEVYSVMGTSEKPTREHVRKMPYLASVIKESTLIISTGHD